MLNRNIRAPFCLTSNRVANALRFFVNVSINDTLIKVLRTLIMEEYT